MKAAQATTHITCNVSCPYCGKYQNRMDELKEHFDDGEPRARDCEAELRCDECKEIFVVDLIEY